MERRGRAPEATADIVVQGSELMAEVEFGPAALHRDAAGWLLRDDAVVFAGSGRPWNELALQTLSGAPGFGADVARTRLVVDFVLPSSAVGRRWYVFEHRGVGCLLFVGADNRVQLEPIDGDPRREENVQRTFLRAIAAALGPGRVLAVPGGVHRLVFDVAASSSRDRATVRIAFEGHEVAAVAVPIDPQRAPTFAILPQQEIAVRRVRASASGL